jgi:hypothetical protein
MSLAWAELKNTIIKAPIQLETEDKRIHQEIDNFNAERFKVNDIDPQSIYVKAGYGKKTQDLINKEVKEKFP